MLPIPRLILISSTIIATLSIGAFLLFQKNTPAQEPLDSLTESNTASNVNTTSLPQSNTETSSPQEGTNENSTSPTEVPQETNNTSNPPQNTAPSTMARIVFAADFSSNGGCADHSETDACDIFTANLNLTTGEISSVAQQTSTSVSESYPVWNPKGTVAYASVFQTPTKKTLNFIDIASGNTGTLINTATWPEVSPDGSTLLYVTSDTDILTQVPLTNNGLSIGTPSALTGERQQEDPDFSPDGKSVIFHQIMSGGAYGVVFDLASKSTAQYTERSGHCTFSGLGDFTVCDNSRGGGLFKRSYTNGTLGESSLLVSDVKPSQLAKYDEVFSSCGGASFNYPTFCGDNTHMLVSTSCNTDASGGVAFSRLFLLDLSTTPPTYRPIGKELAESFGGSGESSWTVDCIQ